VPAGSQATQGALGLGEQIANATSQSFSLIAYCLPLLVGYLADSRFGRYPMIFWGIILCGIGHVLIVAGGAKTLIENETAKIPFFIGVYILAVGAGEFGASPTTHVSKADISSSHVQAQRYSLASRPDEVPRTQGYHAQVWRACHRRPRTQH
jgi:dipeptide/tripeptide permease